MPLSSRSSWSDYSSSPSRTASPIRTFARERPLVEYCTNEWLNEAKYAASAYADPEPTYHGFSDWLEDQIDECFLILRAPRFRRLIIGLVLSFVTLAFLFVQVIGPWLHEESVLWRSLNNNLLAKSAGGLFSSNVRPQFAGMKHVSHLDPRYLPSRSSSKKRLIFVGDIHGCKAELLALMDKVHFQPETDHLIAVGDVVNKGPDSPGVIDYLMANNASCVRGNHEDTLLLMANDVASSALYSHNGEDYHVGKPKDKDPLTKLILQLSADQLNWLRSLPVILKVGNVKGLGDTIVVHGGLVPGVPLDSQDSFSVMNMRTIDLKTHVPSKFHALEGSVPWFRLWSRYQVRVAGNYMWKSLVGGGTTEVERPSFVVYGHDARMGLQIGKYHRGLDTGCVAGGYLTAFVVSGNGKQEIVQVECPGYTKPKKT